MVLDKVLLTQINKTAADSVGQDQTARMCSLILLYTVCKRSLYNLNWPPLYMRIPCITIHVGVSGAVTSR